MQYYYKLLKTNKAHNFQLAEKDPILDEYDLDALTEEEANKIVTEFSTFDVKTDDYYLNSTFFKKVSLITLEISFGINIIVFLAYWAFFFPQIWSGTNP